MLMSLFPGCSMSDVLSSSAAQTVRVELMENIQAFNSSCDQQRSLPTTATACVTRTIVCRQHTNKLSGVTEMPVHGTDLSVLCFDLRLNEKLQKMTLTNQDAASRSEEGQELKLCIDQQEMQMSVKSFLQVRQMIM